MEITEFLHKINQEILNPVIMVLFAVAVAYFTWGVVQFIREAESPDGRKKGQQSIIWGLVGMIIMFGVYVIIRILLNTFGIDHPEML